MMSLTCWTKPSPLWNGPRREVTGAADGRRNGSKRRERRLWFPNWRKARTILLKFEEKTG